MQQTIFAYALSSVVSGFMGRCASLPASPRHPTVRARAADGPHPPHRTPPTCSLGSFIISLSKGGKLVVDINDVQTCDAQEACAKDTALPLTLVNREDIAHQGFNLVVLLHSIKGAIRDMKARKAGPGPGSLDLGLGLGLGQHCC
jgi:hypothetical protein